MREVPMFDNRPGACDGYLSAEQLSPPQFGCPHCGDKTEASLWRKGLADARRVLDELNKRADEC
jgi:hypothetical protein